MKKTPAPVDREPNYITPDGLARLRDEYQTLMHKERPLTVKAVAWAASLGDRSENADYIYNKKRLREIDRRLGFLLSRIEIANVVDPKIIKSQAVVFGATVTIEDEDGKQKTFQIVGQDEIDVDQGKVSWRSPLAKALIGKKVNDEVTIKKPSGDSWAEIVKIEFI
mgnify:CR=1 FL=1